MLCVCVFGCFLFSRLSARFNSLSFSQLCRITLLNFALKKFSFFFSRALTPFKPNRLIFFPPVLSYRRTKKTDSNGPFNSNYWDAKRKSSACVCLRIRSREQKLAGKKNVMRIGIAADLCAVRRSCFLSRSTIHHLQWMRPNWAHYVLTDLPIGPECACANVCKFSWFRYTHNTDESCFFFFFLVFRTFRTLSWPLFRPILSRNKQLCIYRHAHTLEPHKHMSRVALTHPFALNFDNRWMATMRATPMFVSFFFLRLLPRFDWIVKPHWHLATVDKRTMSENKRNRKSNQNKVKRIYKKFYFSHFFFL